VRSDSERKVGGVMSYIPYGYKIENARAVIEESTAAQVRMLFICYLSGDSLSSAAKKAEMNATHSAVGLFLQNKRYLGDDFYPPIIDEELFMKVQEERERRALKLGRTKSLKNKKEVVFPTSFRMNEGLKHFDDPFQQAEYAYSLIERK